MPELPEVEVSRLGISPHIEGRQVRRVIMRRDGLRWPFPAQLDLLLRDKPLLSTSRRAKYLILHFAHGALLIHLGMSGHLRVLPKQTPAKKHDHFDLEFDECILRLSDPRRFGAVLWHDAQEGDLANHGLLRHLGVEPLQQDFHAGWMVQQCRSRTASIKQVLLAGDVVVGVGNIYASESLFHAKIHPKTAACRISLVRMTRLVEAIRRVLQAAIEQGGSSLKDFVRVDGQTGYFQQSYFVYDRAGQPCRVCQGTIRHIKQGQRSSFYCVNCQK